MTPPDPLGLTCYVRPGWEPRIRPASSRRGWMDGTPEHFAYRCLPLAIANAHGWELLSPCGFAARWNGGGGADAVEIRLDPGQEGRMAPVSLFGQGTVTFHVEGVFRTDPGWNLLAGGPPNAAKDGIAPLSGVIETDWSPYSFTMNWRFTRPGHWVRFEENEPFCFIFPVQRGVLGGVAPRIAPMTAEPGLDEAFAEWSRSRDAFHRWVAEAQPEQPADKWQKLYYRGVLPDGRPGPADHQSKLRLCPFKGASAPSAPSPAVPIATEAAETPSGLAARRADWIADTRRRRRALAPGGPPARLHRPTREAFLNDYYALSRPVIMTGMIEDWPARTRWTPDYLKRAVGDVEIEYQGGRDASADFELHKDDFRRTAPFDAFIDRIRQSGNDVYLTAYNSVSNRAALAALEGDLGHIDACLTREGGMLWIGPEGTFTPLHFDLTDNLIVQIVGSKDIWLAPPEATPLLHNRRHVFSDVHDLSDPARIAAFPEAAEVRPIRVRLAAGEALFVPVGWWHQVRALSFSVTMTCTNFLWPNDAWESFPPDG